MSGQLTPDQRARLIELVGETVLQEDAAAVEHSFRDFRNGMAALKDDFDPQDVQPARRGATND